MGRPRKPRNADEKPEVTADPLNRTYGPYSITKPYDQYVIKLGGSVVFASNSEDDVEKYLELLTSK